MKKFMRISGFALLELLAVLVIIAIITGVYFNRGESTKNEISTYQRNMEQSKGAACMANRVALRTSIQMWQLSNPGQALTVENLQKANINVPKCPEDGTYDFKDGQIVCSVHP